MSTTLKIDRPQRIAAALRSVLCALTPRPRHRSDLNTVRLEATGTGLRFVATDSYRLFVVDVDLGEPTFDALPNAVCLDPSGLAAVAKLTAARSAGWLQLTVEPNRVVFDIDDVSFPVAVNADRFANYGAIIERVPESFGPVRFLLDATFVGSLTKAAAALDGRLELRSAGWDVYPVCWTAQDREQGVSLAAYIATIKPPVEQDRDDR